MSFGFGFGLPSRAAWAAGGGEPSLDAQVLALFAAGEQGFWFDPSDMSTMFQDTAGTVPVTAVGQVVARINDKSGRGNFAIQATAANRPTLQQDGAGKLHLLYDGVNDFLATAAVNFTATDKMTVFLGMRKLTDATRAVVVETGWRVEAPATAGVAQFAVTAGGTVLVQTASAAFPAPSTAVLTMQDDIAGDNLRLRVNGVQVASNVADQGTGNFANAVATIGSRVGAVFPFSGHVYGLIARGATSDAAQVASGEAWCNSKAGAF